MALNDKCKLWPLFMPSMCELDYCRLLRLRGERERAFPFYELSSLAFDCRVA